MEIFFAATLLTVMMVTLYGALQQLQGSLCQQEVHINERSPRKR